MTNRRLLVPLDGSAQSNAVLPLARTLATALSASITLLRVISADRVATRYAASNLYRIADELSGCGIETESLVRHGHPVEQIVEEIGVDPPLLVVMRTHGRAGVERAILGSVTEQVLHRTRVPLVLMRPGQRRITRIRNLLVPVDGSAGGAMALDAAQLLARATAASIKLVQITVPLAMQAMIAYEYGEMAVYDPAWDDDTLVSARAEVEALTARLKDGGYTASGEAVMAPHVPRALVDVAEREAVDLIVMSTHALTGPARTVLGSVSDAVVRSAHCPVLLVRRTESAASDAEDTAESAVGLVGG